MKKDIHPKVNTEAKVTCACGNSFVTISTKDNITLEICSNCHPFYTGKQKFIDTEGRIEKFEKLRKQASEKNAKKGTRKQSKKDRKQSSTTAAAQPTLKELLEQARKSN